LRRHATFALQTNTDHFAALVTVVQELVKMFGA